MDWELIKPIMWVLIIIWATYFTIISAIYAKDNIRGEDACAHLIIMSMVGLLAFGLTCLIAGIA